MRLMMAVLMLCLGALGPLTAQKSCPVVTESISDLKFKPGQVWTYRTRIGEPNSTLTILRIDSLPKIGVVVHVMVDGMNAHNPRGERVPRIEHMPFTRDALLGSVDRLLRMSATLPTLEGLERWQHDCGGVYTIPVRDAVEVMERTLNAP